ncbi:MAG: hypothetical protein HQL40_16745 [Alphaproteobacteria bacterium]|nr:hypothetical protein [Alphaproteobacteria bacterium]
MNARRALPFLSIALLASTAQAAEPGRYVLALSWQPAFCETAPDRPECRGAEPAALVLHGLWFDGADAWCRAPEATRKALNERPMCRLDAVPLPPSLRRELDAAMPGGRSCLDRREWWKHGVCSHESAESYYRDSLALLGRLAEGALARLLAARAGAAASSAELCEALAADLGDGFRRAVRLVASKVEGRRLLSEIRITLDAPDGVLALDAARLGAARGRPPSCDPRDVYAVDAAGRSR